MELMNYIAMVTKKFSKLILQVFARLLFLDCPASMFYCRSSKKCIEKELRCDGNRDCNLAEDEAFCCKFLFKYTHSQVY